MERFLRGAHINTSNFLCACTTGICPWKISFFQHGLSAWPLPPEIAKHTTQNYMVHAPEISQHTTPHTCTMPPVSTNIRDPDTIGTSGMNLR